jgi:hypothetical protein
MRTILVAFGDTHGNSTAGLCPPVVNLDDGGTYHISTFQRELWEYYNQDWEFVSKLAKNGNFQKRSEIIVISGGDMGEGDKKERSVQVISRNPTTIKQIAVDNLEPVTKVADKIYFLRGTAAHVGKSASIDEAIAGDCDIAVRQSENVASWWELRLNISGYHIYATHHPPGMIPNPVKVAERLRGYFDSYGEKPPNLGIYFHVHHVKDSGLTMEPRIMSAPCWQLRNEYSYRLPIMQAPQIGMLIFEIENGQLAQIHKRLHPFKMTGEIKA